MSVEPKVPNPMSSLGGKARAAKMSPAERKESARKAAEARWGVDQPRATHDGVLKMPGGVEISCAVLPDGRRVLSQETFLKALGRSPRPKAGTGISGGDAQLDKLPSFLVAGNLKQFIDKELRDSTTPIPYLTATEGKRTLGYLATLLPGVCKVYVEADRAKAIRKTQVHIAVACRALYESLADVGIIALVDEATGYQYERPRLELAEFLALYINKKLAAWAPTFPPEFYREIYRLRGWKFDAHSTARTPEVGNVTNDLVYSRLAPFVLEELKRITPKDDKGRRKHKFHQRLTREPGIKELKDHFKELLAISRGHDEWQPFIRHVNRALPAHPQHPDLFSHIPGTAGGD